ncbi:hypothetical protein [Mycolicibacterium aubagnense]|uniref:PrsW family intramembrane metalloprotease n=1 Tax=Mycolicibacterium aubagnense TaxID=319707 RepID=A0ABM7IN42_9MYCO|nr:hypothetical protein [Mycolicibacterium aubagnense]TLH62758.1 hypothetical protein C1S80_15040 [Mycolicibacterium aubagnense]BBX88144.1 hypothetical protein MAUB_63450 [Mycolicibacterium aubagnense]
MAAAIALIGVDGVIGLVDARPPHRAAAAAIVLVQLVAALTVAALLTRRAVSRSTVALSVYALSLVAVFGSRAAGGLVGWVSHRCSGGGAAFPDVFSRLLEGSAGAFVLAAVLAATYPSAARLQPFWRESALLRLSGCAFLAMLATQVAGNAYVKSGFGAEPWCHIATMQALPPGPAIMDSILAGFQEEFAFTGVAWALFARARMRTQLGALAINIVARLLPHLYYAQMDNVGRWALWIAIWSGGILVLGFVVMRIDLRKRASNTPIPAMVWAAMTGVVVAHSFWDLCGSEAGRLFVVSAIDVAGLAAIAVTIVVMLVRTLRWVVRRRRANSAVE